ncbi:MAG TPA: hypothetical protein VLG71_03385 [Candidatus Limnocylindria bacterium]|nr:hypothetical protein [Candidatus Limnocylindria bacterium]
MSVETVAAMTPPMQPIFRSEIKVNSIESPNVNAVYRKRYLADL